MKKQSLIVQMMITFVITLFTTMIVTLIWNLIIDKTGAIIDWKTSFLLAIVMGIAIPLVKTKN